MSARTRFVAFALEQIGKPVLWGRKGPEAFDCSGLVTASYFGIGGKDLRSKYNSQRLSDETPNLESSRPELVEALPGDLLFYGLGPDHVEHVAIVLAGGRSLSADGATQHHLDIRVAEANPRCRVRIHERFNFRLDLPYRAVHRNTFVDLLDGISL